MKLTQLEDGSFLSIREWDDVKDQWPYLQIDHNGKPQAKERGMTALQTKALQFVFIVVVFILGMAIGAHAQTYQTFGNTTYGSDGSTAQTYGNTTYYQPPANQPQVICQTYGNMTYCN